MPKFSIITICYNEPQLRRTCESIVNQTFQDFEWIVMDACSNAETQAIFDEYKGRINIFVSEKDKGIYDGLNKGIVRATGEYLNFMNAGDCFSNNNVLQIISDSMDKDGKQDVVYGYSIYDGNSDLNGKKHYVPIEEYHKDKYRWICGGLPHQAMFFKRELFDKYGLYDLKYSVYADWAFNIKIWQAGCSFRFIDESVAIFNHNGLSASTWDTVKGITERFNIIKEFYPEFIGRLEFKHPKIAGILYRVLRLLVFPSNKYRNLFRRKYKMAFVALEFKKISIQNLLFIAHSYHQKTRSCDFMIDLLKKDFNVTVSYDDSWKDGEKFDLSEIKSGNYKYIVFWQQIPNKQEFRKIRHNNMIWFPMADSVIYMKPRHFRRYGKKVKIINFSEQVHNKCVGLGLKSLYVKYFIKPVEFKPGNKNSVFFWNRTNQIDINKIIKVVGNTPDIKIHMHTAIDPFHELVMPSAQDEEKYNITYSEWFENKNDFTNKICESGIYIAPRMCEGIGMSFLEVMSMGKAV